MRQSIVCERLSARAEQSVVSGRPRKEVYAACFKIWNRRNCRSMRPASSSVDKSSRISLAGHQVEQPVPVGKSVLVETIAVAAGGECAFNCRRS